MSTLAKPLDAAYGALEATHRFEQTNQSSGEMVEFRRLKARYLHAVTQEYVEYQLYAKAVAERIEKYQERGTSVMTAA